MCVCMQLYLMPCALHVTALCCIYLAGRFRLPLPASNGSHCFKRALRQSRGKIALCFAMSLTLATLSPAGLNQSQSLSVVPCLSPSLSVSLDSVDDSAVDSLYLPWLSRTAASTAPDPAALHSGGPLLVPNSGCCSIESRCDCDWMMSSDSRSNQPHFNNSANNTPATIARGSAAGTDDVAAANVPSWIAELTSLAEGFDFDIAQSQSHHQQEGHQQQEGHHQEEGHQQQQQYYHHQQQFHQGNVAHRPTLVTPSGSITAYDQGNNNNNNDSTVSMLPMTSTMHVPAYGTASHFNDASSNSSFGTGAAPATHVPINAPIDPQYFNTQYAQSHLLDDCHSGAVNDLTEFDLNLHPPPLQQHPLQPSQQHGLQPSPPLQPQLKPPQEASHQVGGIGSEELFVGDVDLSSMEPIGVVGGALTTPSSEITTFACLPLNNMVSAPPNSNLYFNPIQMDPILMPMSVFNKFNAAATTTATTTASANSGASTGDALPSDPQRLNLSSNNSVAAINARAFAASESPVSSTVRSAANSPTMPNSTSPIATSSATGRVPRRRPKGSRASANEVQGKIPTLRTLIRRGECQDSELMRMAREANRVAAHRYRKQANMRRSEEEDVYFQSLNRNQELQEQLKETTEELADLLKMVLERRSKGE